MRPPNCNFPAPCILRFLTQKVWPCKATRYRYPSSSSNLIGTEYHRPLFLPLTLSMRNPLDEPNPSLPTNNRRKGFATCRIIQLDLLYGEIGSPFCFMIFDRAIDWTNVIVSKHFGAGKSRSDALHIGIRILRLRLTTWSRILNHMAFFVESALLTVSPPFSRCIDGRNRPPVLPHGLQFPLGKHANSTHVLHL